jgi:predicted transcriptional regulator of viral defense system
MDHLAKIRANYPNSLFTPHDLRDLGISRYYLELLVQSGEVQNPHRGIFCLAGVDLSQEAQFRSATIRIGGPSAVCLLSALVHYNLIVEIPRETWLLVPDTKHTAHKDIRLVRSRNPKWKIGIVNEEGYRITNIERSIVDTLALKKTTQIGIQALKSALKDEKTTLDKILKSAKALKVDHRVMSYIEALA